jgi:hypothetical protein
VTQRSDSRARSWRQADVVTNSDRLGGAECRSSDATIGQEETWNPCPDATAKRSFGEGICDRRRMGLLTKPFLFGHSDLGHVSGRAERCFFFPDHA